MTTSSTGADSVTKGRLVTTGQAARVLGVTTTAVRKMAARGDLVPVEKLDGPLGAYLFGKADVTALATRRLAEQKARLERAERELKGEVA